jgi:hypothetical protein
VASFPEPATAQRFGDKARDVFTRCSGRTVNLRQVDVAGARDDIWTVGPAADQNGTLSLRNTAEGGNGWACRRGLSVHSNVVVDVSACGYGVGEPVIPALVNPIVAKIDGH